MNTRRIFWWRKQLDAAKAKASSPSKISFAPVVVTGAGGGAAPVRLNRSFDGLSNEMREVLGKDPMCGHVFVFINRRRTMAKLLVWTRGDFTIVHKRRW